MSKSEIKRGSHTSMTAQRADDRADKKSFTNHDARAKEVKRKIEKAGQSIHPSNVVSLVKAVKTAKKNIKANSDSSPIGKRSGSKQRF
jgi:hypothetical protein